VSPSPADAFEQIDPPVNELLLLDTKSWHRGGKARGQPRCRCTADRRCETRRSRDSGTHDQGCSSAIATRVRRARSLSGRRRTDASGARRCGGRTEQSAPPRRIFPDARDEKRAARDRHWQPVKFGDFRLAPRADGVGFLRAPSLEFLLVHHSEVKPGGADARFRRARMIPRCGPRWRQPVSVAD
jgi:hypothetical protein